MLLGVLLVMAAQRTPCVFTIRCKFLLEELLNFYNRHKSYVVALSNNNKFEIYNLNLAPVIVKYNYIIT